MNKNEEKKNVVILGAGFAGVRAALDLSHLLSHAGDDYEIILVDKHDYLTYYSGLYEAATTEHGRVEARKVKNTVAISLEKIFARTKVKVFKAYVDSIDLENGKVVTDSRILPYDYLLIALGSVTDYYGIPGLEKYAFSLKSLDDAIMIRNRVEDIITKKDNATIVIGGGGFAGTEFASELHNLMRIECMHHGKDLKNYRLLVVEGGTSYLPGLPENVSRLVSNKLTKLGIESRFSTLITEATKDYVTLNKTEQVSTDLLIWTGGVRSCKLPVVNCVLDCDKKDRVQVMDSLNLKKHPNVFLAGDNACINNPETKKSVPQTAHEAIEQGKVVAKNIYRAVSQKPLLSYFGTSTLFVIPTGGKSAVFYSPYLVMSGFAGWMMRKLADLRYFLTVLPLFAALKYFLFENRIFMKND
jgi:NADH dehydrogenase